MTYLPNPTVTIDGQDYTGRTIGQVSINRGRQDVYSAPRAGYASVELIDVTAGELGFEVGAPISVSMENTGGTAVPMFTGIVSDWASEVVATGGQPVVVYRLQAVGPLAKLNRRAVLAAGSPSETDGERVAAALGEALPVPWDEFSTLQTWAQVGSAVTWESVDPGYEPDLIDPGVYTLVALGSADAGYSALSVVTDAGLSGKGLLFETPDGFIGYADADRRPDNAAAGFLDIPYSVLSVGGLGLSSSLADITNRVTVKYGSDESVTQDDDFSIGRFGLQQTTLSTLLADQSNAEDRADDFLFAHSVPSVELSQVTVNLRGGLSGTLRDALLGINSNDAARVTGLPAKLGLDSGGFRGFVEGVQVRVSDFEATVTLFVSDELLSFGSVLWGQVADTIDWQNVNATLTWADARRVTV